LADSVRRIGIGAARAGWPLRQEREEEPAMDAAVKSPLEMLYRWEVVTPDKVFLRPAMPDDAASP
jgi:hypothetical protein